MAALTFGPEWLRNMAGGNSLAAGSSVSTAASAGPGSGGNGGPAANSSYSSVRYKLAEHRYGREEMLALFAPSIDIPEELKDFSFVMSVKSLQPLALEPMSKEEQNLLLQCVNSTPMVRSMGRGATSMRGGRGEADRGRGRGRGRGDEDGLGKLRTRDTWEDRGNRVYERGYSAYGTEDSSSGSTPRELSRSVSTESWRENRQHVDDNELDIRKPERDRWYDPKDRYGPKNWREPRNEQHEYEDSRRGRPPTEPVRKIEYKRSRSSGSTSVEEEAFQNVLPEWSTTNPLEVESVGTFDSSGAFLPVKEKSVEKCDEDGMPSVVVTGSRSCASGVMPSISPSEVSNNASLASSSDANRASSTLKDRVSPNCLDANGVAGSSSSSSLSPLLPQSHADIAGLKHQQPPPIVNVNNRTVDGAGCELTAAAVHRRNDATIAMTMESAFIRAGEAGGVIPMSGVAGMMNPLLQMAVTEQQEPRSATTDVADFVSKWTGENEGTHVNNGQPSDLLNNNDPWFYKDPQGDIQGPFNSAEMNDWLKTGYFTMNLLVRRGGEGEFCRLGELIKTLGYVPFEPRPGISSIGINPVLPLPPVVSGLNQQQQQLQQKLEQLRKMQQHQLLVAIQQQQQGLLQADYVRHLQMMHQQQLQQLTLQHQQQQLHLQQAQSRLPHLLVQDGFNMRLPGYDPLLGPVSASLPPAPAMHPAALTNSSELYAHLLQPSQPPVASLAGLSNTVAPGLMPTNITAMSDAHVSSAKLEAEVPTTVEQIEKMQFLVLEKEREEKRLEGYQRIERERLEEERRRKADEERRVMEDEMRRVGLERKRLEEERRKLEELQRQMELDRLQQEQKIQVEKMEKERRLQEQMEEEERLRQAQLEEERERVWLERKRLEEQLKRDTELKRKQAEAEAREKAEAEARKKAVEAETRQKAEAEVRKKAEAEAKRKLEMEAKQKAEAEARQRVEAEARQKLEELERIKQAQRAAKPAWTTSSEKASKNGASNVLTLSEIQEAERMMFAVERQQEMERQKLAAAFVSEQTKQSGSTWSAQRTQAPVKSVPSLLQIQHEQEKQLREQGHGEKAHLMSTKVAESLTWKPAAPQPPQWNKPGSIWSTPEPVGRKKTVAVAESNAQFPALGAAASGKKTAATKSEKAGSKTKKEEDVVQKLFQVTKVRDELTEWCEFVLNGLQTSVDIPTLVDLLKDLESPGDVTEYVRMYLGESKQVRDFTQQFLERRAKQRGTSKQAEENPWSMKSSVPAHAQVTASATGGRQQQHQQQSKVAAVAAAPQKQAEQAGGDKSKGKKKKKMQKVDSSILGFNVCADPNRTNVGEIDSI